MDLIKEWWGAIVAVIGLGIWLVRLEAGSKMALIELTRIEKRIDDDRETSRTSRQEQNDMLREMRADIKRLLERKGSGPS